MHPSVLREKQEQAGAGGLLSRDASAGENRRQAGLATCSSMSHRGGHLAFLLSNMAALSVGSSVVNS